MKILTVLGSPRINGNTAKPVRIFEDALKPEHSIEHIDLQELNIAGFMKYAEWNSMMHIGQVVAAPMEEGVVEPHVEAALKALAKSLVEECK